MRACVEPSKTCRVAGQGTRAVAGGHAAADAVNTVARSGHLAKRIVCVRRPSARGVRGAGFTFSFLKKNSVTTGNGIPAEISRFSGNFDWKEFSNLKFRNFGIPAGFSVHLAGFSVLFTEK